MDDLDRKVLAFVEAIGADDGAAVVAQLEALLQGEESAQFELRLGLYAVGMARELYGEAWLGGFALVRMDSVFDRLGSDDA